VRLCLLRKWLSSAIGRCANTTSLHDNMYAMYATRLLDREDNMLEVILQY
jgi:hypothetical protein